MFQQTEIPGFHLNAKLYLVTYLSQGMAVKGYMAVPRGSGPFPVFVYCRGGIRRVGMTKLAWVSRYVEEGFLVFAPFYRGNRGGAGREDFGGEDRYDVIDAVRVLSTHPWVDPDRIHLFGFSRGSLNALLAAMELTTVKTVSVWGGVSDLVLTYEERVDLRRMLKRVLGGSPNKVPQAYYLRSPVHFTGQLSCPVYIIHGKKDRQVGVEHAYRLAAALNQAGKEYEIAVYEEFDHHFPPLWRDYATKRMFDWIRDKEKQKTEKESIH